MKRSSYLLLFLILTLAAILRFYNVKDIPFTHDEFSAVNRTHFNNFTDLIEKGVEVDFHPAGVQVFLYYWTKIGGEGEVWVKLPFILSGILAIALFFALAKKRFGISTAVVGSTLLTTASYSMYYGQIARPYVSGLFLVMVLFLFWQNIVYERSHKRRDFIGLAIALALCAYNHHFSAVQAAVIAVSGIFMIQADQRKMYLLALVGSLILYAPNIPIFWVQIQKGGVGGAEGWLGAPQGDFLVHYIKYIFNFSWWVYVPVIVLVGASFYKAKRQDMRLRLLMLVWFAVPFTIGFVYSYLVNPILQVSVLIFAFPFLLMALFGGIPKWNFKGELAVFMVLASVGVYSMVYQRQYYRLFYNSAYEQIVKETVEFDQATSIHFVNSHPEINAHYEKVYQAEGKYEWISNDEDTEELKAELDEVSYNYLTYGFVSSANPVWLNIMADHYPYVERLVDYEDGSFYALAKKGREKLYYSEHCLLGNGLESSEEWISLYEGNLEDLVENEHKVIDANVIIDSISQGSKLYWVWQVSDANDKVLDWRSDEIENVKGKHYFSVRVRDSNVPVSGSKVKLLLWNMNKDSITVKDGCVKVRAGNPLLYGLQHKLK